MRDPYGEPAKATLEPHRAISGYPRVMPHSISTALALLTAVSISACGDDSIGSDATTTGAGAAGSATSATVTGSSTAKGASGSTATGAGGSAPIDPCGDALLCEKFDDYPAVASIDNDQEFGPWKAALKTPGATMELDGAHTTSGNRALHMHIDTAETAGGRLFASGDKPIFEGHPTHVYGRMMMYIDPNGPSIHWTFFGVSGDADSTSPAAGRHASYLLSSLPRDGVNTYSFVYGLSAAGNDPYHDCSLQSHGAMPTATWQCVSFEMDSLGRHLRMTENGAATPTVSVDEHGNGCVGDVPNEDPWYGPEVDQLYVGAWSFHDMVSPLDVWIDDLVVDTKPVDCPAP